MNKEGKAMKWYFKLVGIVGFVLVAVGVGLASARIYSALMLLVLGVVCLVAYARVILSEFGKRHLAKCRATKIEELIDRALYN